MTTQANLNFLYMIKMRLDDNTKAWAKDKITDKAFLRCVEMELKSLDSLAQSMETFILDAHEKQGECLVLFLPPCHQLFQANHANQ